MLEALQGQHGIAAVQVLRVRSLGATEEYLLAAGAWQEQVLDAETIEKLLALPGRAVNLPRAGAAHGSTTPIPEPALAQQPGLDFGAAHVPLPQSLEQELARQRATVLGTIEQRNLALFSDETEKLDAWADDLKVGLEREIKELDRTIKECRTEGKGAATLAEKLEHQKLQRTLETTRDKKRRELFDRQDEIQARRDKLIEELEIQLRQEVDIHTVLASQWRLQ